MTKTKRKSMIKFLCWVKVNSVALKALIGMEVSHEKFDTIMKEKKIREHERKCDECK